MAVNCGVPYGLCAVRVTELDSEGNAEGSFAVSRNPITVGFNPNIDQGQQFISRNGCGCAIARIRSNDVFNWFELSFGQDALMPELESLLIDELPILDGADIVGVNGVSALECDEEPPTVGFEMWAQHYVGSGRDSIHRFVHWVFPRSRWQRGNNTIAEGIGRTNISGFSQTNALWGSGPYGDGPPDGQDVTEWAYWKTNEEMPEAITCGDLGTVTPGS